MKICAIIPVHNEEYAIGGIVDALVKNNQTVIVIDDGSIDNSGKIAKAKGAIVIRNEHKNGKGNSLRKGFDYAIKEGFDGVITVDGDGQHDVNDFEKFIEFAKEEKDVVVNGNRMTDSTGMPFIRRLTNKFMSILISMACKQSIPDTQCGYRYIGSGVLKQLNLSSSQFEIETEILMKASKKGFKIYSVPIRTIYRNEVSKINPLKDTIRFFIYFLGEIFSK
ncbi:MAG: glycosyltransferase family 2 protein [Candidatus Omnitrophica bacterium]|nr:glycosyltransferase family 2 protein [Candidatus Omnitrophota bacterium]MBU1995741.1 glycosyltransferase family 2 protein [Candidatus Omnitrophota bacterium]